MVMHFSLEMITRQHPKAVEPGCYDAGYEHIGVPRYYPK